ncbi:bouquet formation protein 1 [Desmophyllum pertusum]|uniref:Bouquet formation protein 1 n=1 Tax=Desmophyllum pertusum TaxID=174260 RepID=A0A9W9ZD13_9CNID|nr:bouquet formation protein 1 [Desmophyllum pertusum]
MLLCCDLNSSDSTEGTYIQWQQKQRNIILPTTALIAAIVSGNAECQSKVRLLGGLRALINLLRQHVELKEPADQDVSFIEHVVDTIGSAIAGHAICLDSAADLGLVSLLIQCIDLSHTPGVDDAVAKQFRTKCILALSICVDQCERNQQQLRDREGLELLIELLTQEQVTTPTRDAETQTDYQETLSVCTTAGQCSTDTRERIPTGEVTQETLSVCTTGGQCRTNTRERVPTGEMTQESSPSSRKAIQRKKRFVTSCKVLTPLTRSKNCSVENDRRGANSETKN